MKSKLFAAALILLFIVWIPLIVPVPPTAAQIPATNTPTTEAVGGSEQVVVELPERVTFDGQRFQITGFEFERTNHTMGRVAVEVLNISTESASGRVWYLLAPPDAAEPWNEAVFSAEPQLIIDLAAGETARYEFNAPPTDVIGEYRVSVWVHQTEADGSSIHSDGVGYDQTQMLAPSVYLSVEHVDYLETEAGETILFVTLDIRNFTSVMTEVAYSYTLAAPDDPTPWQTGVYVLPFQSLLLMPNQAIQLTTRSLVTLTGEDLQVIGWLQERVGDEMQFRNNDPYP